MALRETPRGLQPVPSDTADIDRFVVATDLVAVGAFACPTSHPRFHDTGPIRNHCFVFPRTSSRIVPDGFAPFVGDQGVIAVYNAGQAYTRDAISPSGDRCDYLAVNEHVLREALGRWDPEARQRQRLLTRSHLPARPSWYLRQRRIFRQACRIERGIPSDALHVEEAVLTLVGEIARDLSANERPASREPSRGRRDLVEAALAILATRLDRRLTLGHIAAALGVSPFHLCRVFRQVTGVTLHRRREQLRLARALDVMEENRDLTAVAHEVGYSSHSHFTAAFRRAYGVTPSAHRDDGSRRVRQVRRT